ncbi:NAD dependent epimerase/dehydratase family enzyme [Microbacteriaceae bacterium SG_E_30_P1]|uniref:NAD dependent epimerase/dehydratase family enzyme n=1 Tax=Antiquaquibacter oligotrophicus TaxID=2880260 RepID=A0ABT6KME4_9MICO|nr:DUF1731 domain-containing protein [Antiquaquibacter oligotrophicus]MDH6180941.1 NAD dependent epimerase/dehydratase family enzyme [Antiquaquibacter oligotrophicus]UDF13356.1 DUF1731 domain-containing protein [Antiquaquibacter oligotrophicus]
MTQTPRKIVIAGASGFVGRYLVERHRARGTDVITVGRRDSVTWSDADALSRAVDGASLVINLAGRSVDCRYTPENRRIILTSRTETTAAMKLAIERAGSPPPLWVNSSTATIYRHAMDRPQTESSGELGEGFSVSVARSWEQTLLDGELPGTRRVALRMAIVLGQGSVLERLVTLARRGVAGPQWDTPWFPSRRRREAGTEHRFGAPWGRQKFSWIHVEDVHRMIDFLVANPDIDGAINASSPGPVDNRTLMHTLRKVLRIPFGIPVPRPALELGAALMGTETELILKSRWVVPERMTAAGFTFTYPELETAIRSILD